MTNIIDFFSIIHHSFVIGVCQRTLLRWIKTKKKRAAPIGREFAMPVATRGIVPPPRNHFHLTHYLLMDAQSIYEMPSISRCLVFVMLSIAALGIDRPRQWQRRGRQI